MLVVVLQEALDHLHAFDERVEDRILQALARQLREEAFDGVGPGGQCWREVKCPVRIPGQPLVDNLRLVRGDVVEDDVNIGAGLDALGDMVETRQELLGAVPLRQLPDRSRDAASDISSLYRDRWSIEELYKASKGLHLQFHSRSERGVKQELDANLTLVLLARLAANRCEAEAETAPSTDDKDPPPLHANFRNAPWQVGR